MFSDSFLRTLLSMPYIKRQLQWIARTVMVKENNIEEAMQVLGIQNCLYFFQFGDPDSARMKRKSRKIKI